LLENGEMRRTFGVEGRKMVMEKFDIQKQYDFLEKEFNLLREKAEFSNKSKQ
jgi:S-adenosylmethionine:diacylglycerol 3-amino-3-carboxypropyl transferase